MLALVALFVRICDWKSRFTSRNVAARDNRNAGLATHLLAGNHDDNDDMVAPLLMRRCCANDAHRSGWSADEQICC